MNNKGSGHRDRLRKKFLLDPKYLSTYEEVELLLTYAIPRKDVQPIAAELIKRYGDLQTISSQPISDLETITGIGEAGAIYLSFIGHLLSKQQQKDQNTDMTKQQIDLFDFPATQQVKPKTINLFANDEIANSLKFLSEAYTYPTKDDFEAYLVNALPYNSESTRKRRARYIMSRFISYSDIKNPLTYLFSMTNNDSVKQNALFYVIQKQELIANHFAEEVIWPNLALGYVLKPQVGNFVIRYFPEAKEKTVYEVQKALLNTYGILQKGEITEDRLFYSLQNGDLESFLFVLTSEYPQPETIPFEKIMNGFIHHHMLWHRDWIKDQLYRLREMKIISKITEIDFLNQFTIAVDQMSALKIFYQNNS